jgi:hypothetical protein
MAEAFSWDDATLENRFVPRFGNQFAIPPAMGLSLAPIATTVGAFLLCSVSVVGCKPDASSSGPAPVASEDEFWKRVNAARSAQPQPTISGAPIPVAEADAILNPDKLPPYAGPSGIVEGTIRISGAPPPDVPLKLPSGCMIAEGTYGRLFREGKDRTVADVLVAVTGYEAYLPAKDQAVKVNIDGCAFSGRTFAMTFGQRMEVQNLERKNSYIPVLHGSRYTAFAVAIPLGDPVKLYPHRVGQYQLADNMSRPWMTADVFVLKYTTHDVTDIDGKYRIEGIPVGEMRVNALLPVADIVDEKIVTVKDGQVTTLDFVLPFDRAKYEAKVRPSPPPSSSVPVVPPVK